MKVQVGIGVIVTKNGKVLLGKRKGAHGEGTWSFPGGKLEFAESWEACAIREVKEETGLEIFNLKVCPTTNDMFLSEGKHFVTPFIQCETTGEPQLMEPNKCEGWEWVDWDEFPHNIFLPIQNLKKTGFRPF